MLQNLHLHSNNINSAKKYIKYTRIKFPNEQIKLSFTNHGSMYNSDYIKDLCERFKIEYYPGYGIETKENIEFNIFNPKIMGLEFLSKLIEEKINWLNLIFEELYNIHLPIHINNMLFRLNKTLEEITITDICEELTQPEHLYHECSTIEITLNRFVQPIISDIERLKPKISQILDILKEETLYLVNPNEFPELILDTRINGIIYNNSTNKDILEKCNNLNKSLVYGNGIIV